MTDHLTERLQNTRLTVIGVDRAQRRVRVRGNADACSELACAEQTLVLTDEGSGGLETLNPGDIIKVQPANGHADTIIVLRRAWEEIASPEV